MAEEFQTPTEAFQWARIRDLEAALRDIGDASRAEDADPLEWATWAHDRAQAALNGEK